MIRHEQNEGKGVCPQCEATGITEIECTEDGIIQYSRLFNNAGSIESEETDTNTNNAEVKYYCPECESELSLTEVERILL